MLESPIRRQEVEDELAQDNEEIAAILQANGLLPAPGCGQP